MKSEIESAATFLSGLVKLHTGVSGVQLDQFRESIIMHLVRHYQSHWFPEKPFKGSGYRCIRINHKMDPILAKAGAYCGLNENQLKTLFPNELTMWIDPKEVSYRIGENGSICVLYDADSELAMAATVPARTTPSPSSSSDSSSLSSTSYLIYSAFLEECYLPTGQINF